MRQQIALTLGTIMIAGGLLGASLTFGLSGVSADEHESTVTHEQLHAMMDAMMGEGVSERMHEAMPGSEEMMDACIAGMNGGMMHGMDGMMHGGQMNGMDDMMNDIVGQ